MNYRRTSRLEGILLADYVDAVTALSPAVFSLPTLFLFPSIESIGIILLGALIGTIFFSALCTLEDIKRLKNCLSGFLSPFCKCDFSEYHVQDFSSRGTKISRETEGMNASFFGYQAQLNLRRDIFIYVVKRGKSTIVPTQMTSYETFNAPSYIFVRDEPEKITPLGRFFIYHEVGHASWQNNVSRRFSHIGWKFFLLPVFWGIINLKPSLLSFFMLAAYILVLFIIYLLYKFVLPHQLRPIEEAGADLFSISCMSQQERSELIDYLTKANQLPKDQLLTNEQNFGRYHLLLDHLENLKSSLEEDNPIIMIHSKTASYYLLVLAILVPIMGLLSRVPSINLLCISAVCLLVFISIGLSLENKKKGLVGEIQRILSKHS